MEEEKAVAVKVVERAVAQVRGPVGKAGVTAGAMEVAVKVAAQEVVKEEEKEVVMEEGMANVRKAVARVVEERRAAKVELEDTAVKGIIISQSRWPMCNQRAPLPGRKCFVPSRALCQQW